MSKLFGTDGIRGTVNAHPMTSRIAMDVAVAAGHVFREGLKHRPTVLIAKDTRLSGYQMEPAMVSGFTSAGWDVLLLGNADPGCRCPDPVDARGSRGHARYRTVLLHSASSCSAHSYKLSDAVEAQIEASVARMANEGPDFALAEPDKLGRVRRLDGAAGRYMELVKASFPDDLRLDGLQVAVDCAHGAAYRIAPRMLYELGADVIELGVEPDGLNINRDCGATAPEALRHKVAEVGADIGLALDGDADACASSTSAVRSSTAPDLALFAHRRSTGCAGGGDHGHAARARAFPSHDLRMGRPGLRPLCSNACATWAGISAVRAHPVRLRHHRRRRSQRCGCWPSWWQQRRASEVLNLVTPVPQVLKNVRFTGANPLDAGPVQALIATAEQEFGDAGRLVIRKSGTEPLIRVMAEGDDAAQVEAVVDRICEAVQAQAG